MFVGFFATNPSHEHGTHISVHERATSPLFKASAFAFRSFPLLICLPSAFAPLGNKRHHHHHPWTQALPADEDDGAVGVAT